MRAFFLIDDASKVQGESKQACLICRVATKVNNVNPFGKLNSLASKPVGLWLVILEILVVLVKLDYHRADSGQN